MVIDKISLSSSIKINKPLFRSYKLGRGVIGNTDVFLVKPLTYMNNSGRIFPDLLRRLSLTVSSLVVVCDNLDLPCGSCRIKKKGSHGGHNGLKSIVNAIGSAEFTRIFVGIGRPFKKDQIVSYVLSEPPESEFEKFYDGVERAADAALKLVSKSVDEVMSEYNRRITVS